jgi:hydrogenase/urease accessory protein HupE
MSTSTILIAAALVAALLLVGARKSRGYAIGAAVVAGIGLVMALGLVRVAVPHVELALAGALAVLGVLLVLRVDAKPHVIAATVIAAIGGVQLFTALF